MTEWIFVFLFRLELLLLLTLWLHDFTPCWGLNLLDVTRADQARKPSKNMHKNIGFVASSIIINFVYVVVGLH